MNRVSRGPAVDIRLGSAQPMVVRSSTSHAWQPGDFLNCDYTIDLRTTDLELSAVESTVMWYTDGKGEEDLGVHFFQRKSARELDLRQRKIAQRLGTVLPATPLSYAGQIVNVVWCVRIRLFFVGGDQNTFDQVFQLGGATSENLRRS